MTQDFSFQNIKLNSNKKKCAFVYKDLFFPEFFRTDEASAICKL